MFDAHIAVSRRPNRYGLHLNRKEQPVEYQDPLSSWSYINGRQHIRCEILYVMELDSWSVEYLGRATSMRWAASMI